ncbi:hypothetical protein ABRY23_12110 [Melioribacteraceae bacterium 4301-Me]|uniref:hypothetical protein n=1 Tax=Pyranulibacter aquaticus TaxID=3163344 RepID=UPI0035980364
MLIKYIICFMVLLFLFNSCNENPTQPVSAEQFYPLKVGNKWYYKYYHTNGDTIKYDYSDSEYELYREVIGVKKINGKNYSIMESKNSNPLLVNHSDTTYLRTDRYKLYFAYKDATTNQYIERMFADFSLEKADTFHIVKDAYEWVVTVKEKTTNIIKFHYEIPNAADEEYEETYVKNVGLKSSYSTDWHMGIMLVNYELK